MSRYRDLARLASIFTMAANFDARAQGALTATIPETGDMSIDHSLPDDVANAISTYTDSAMTADDARTCSTALVRYGYRMVSFMLRLDNPDDVTGPFPDGMLNDPERQSFQAPVVPDGSPDVANASHDS